MLTSLSHSSIYFTVNYITYNTKNIPFISLQSLGPRPVALVMELTSKEKFASYLLSIYSSKLYMVEEHCCGVSTECMLLLINPAQATQIRLFVPINRSKQADSKT